MNFDEFGHGRRRMEMMTTWGGCIRTVKPLEDSMARYRQWRSARFEQFIAVSHWRIDEPYICSTCEVQQHETGHLVPGLNFADVHHSMLRCM